jgi:hypothetical protein
VLHHKKKYDKHTGHGEQEDNSPVGPSIRRASPLQTQDQADGHGKLNCQPIPVETFQPLSCTWFVVRILVQMIYADGHAQCNSASQTHDSPEVDPPIVGMGD